MSEDLKNNIDPNEPDFGDTIITLTDEEGNDIELEYVDTIESDGVVYMAFFPTLDEDVDPEQAEEDEEYGLIILKVVATEGDDELVTIDNDEELEKIYNLFMEQLFDDEDEDEE